MRWIRELVVGERSSLVLPGPAHEPWVLVPESSTVWRTEDGSERVADRDRVSLGERRWTLSLPGPVVATETRPGSVPDLHETQLAFTVSLHQEHIAAALRWPGGELDLGSRVHHLLLLTLARRRLADAERDALSAGEHGWIHRSELLRMLKVDEATLNLHVYRARRQLTEAGVPGGGEVVERRTDAGELRIGVADLLVADV